jgi:triosephosphate isomerase
VNLEVRKPVIAGNWKMNKTIGEARSLAIEVKNKTLNMAGDVDVILFPAFTALAAVADVLKGSKVGLGGQNLHWEEKGAFTGEISAGMLLDAGCEYVIIGHSERRKYFSETDETVSRKAHAALAAGLKPVICVGETLEEREAGGARDVVRGQVMGSLRGISEENILRAIVAYEPVWAIGTGKTATPAQAQEMHAFIRNILIDLYGLDVALRVRMQYGGSVKPDNIADLMAETDIDGALVGGASLEAAGFARIVGFKGGGS